MTFQDFFSQAIAYNPTTGALVTDADFTVHAVDDASLSTSLAVTDPASGVTITTLRSSSVGVLPDMRVAGDPPQVLIKSGAFVTKVTSLYGAVLAAGLDPATVQGATDAARAATGSAADAAQDALNAAVAQAAAQAAADRAEAVAEINAVAWGVPNDGVAGSDAQISALFASGVERVYFPAGDYVMADQVSLTLTRSLHVRCDAKATFRFVDNVAASANKVMFQLYGDRTQTTPATLDLSWTGGVLDGNDANQGDENSAPWESFDTCKAMRIVRFRSVEISWVTVGEFRGHGINHWNNHEFFAHDITVNQAISVRQPEGGSRRDGITGSSDITRYHRISGFAADDLCAVLAGAASAPKGFSGWSTWDADVVLAEIRDVLPSSKTDLTVVERHTWHAVAGHVLNGFRIRHMDVRNVHGTTAKALVRVGGYQAGYFGAIDRLSIEDVSGDTPGTEAHVFLGGTSAEVPTEFGDVSIKRYSRAVSRTTPSSNNIMCWYMNARKVTVDDAEVVYSSGTATPLPLVDELGATHLETLVISKGRVRDLVAADNTEIRLYRKNSTVAATTRLFASEVDLGPAVASSTRRTITISGTGAVAVFGDEVVVEHGATEAAIGAHLTDPFVGVLAVLPGGSWEQKSRPVNAWNSSTFGKPQDGYWRAGMSNRVIGAPLGACLGWLCVASGMAGAAGFVAISHTGPSNPSSLTLTWVPSASNTTPGTVVSREIGAGEGAAFPGGDAGTLTLHVGRDSLAWTYQTYRSRSTGQMYSRAWSGSAWSAWV